MLERRTRIGLGIGATGTVLAMALACGPSSNLNSNDMVKLHGSVQTPTGTSQANTQVNLIRIPDLLEAFTAGTVLVGSLGTECLASNPPPLCSTFRHTTSGSDGTYQFALMGSDTQGSVGQAVNWYLEFTGETPAGRATAPSTGGVFVINTTDLLLPTLRLWNPTSAVTSANGQYAFTWTSLMQDVGVDASGYTVKLVTGGDVPAWQTSAGTQTNIAWDARAAEDFTGNWWVEATRRTSATSTDVDITHRGAGLAFAAGNSVPISRAKSCQVQHDGVASPLGSGPCVLTDGSMATSYAPAGPACTPPDGGTCTQTNDNWIMVDLGATTSVSRVYVRHYVGTAFTIEVSTDGTTFSSAGNPQSNNGYYEVVFAGALPARYVRMRATDASQMLGGFNEFSVF